MCLLDGGDIPCSLLSSNFGGEGGRLGGAGIDARFVLGDVVSLAVLSTGCGRVLMFGGGGGGRFRTIEEAVMPSSSSSDSDHSSSCRCCCEDIAECVWPSS